MHRSHVIEWLLNADLVTIGRRIKDVREILGISQIDLAKRLNVSRKRMGEYESGSAKRKLREIDFLEKVAAALSSQEHLISMVELLGIDKN